MKTKADIRTFIKEKREKLTKAEKDKFDEEIYEKLLSLPSYIGAKNIFVFVSFGDEVDTHAIINKALADKKQVSVPKVISKAQGMLAISIDSLEELAPGVMGILEPKTINVSKQAKRFDLVILPGLAFDKSGGRLGYGGGFYDKFLQNLNKDCKLIGLGYDFQIIEKVPMENWDIKIQGVITESNFYNFKEDER